MAETKQTFNEATETEKAIQPTAVDRATAAAPAPTAKGSRAVAVNLIENPLKVSSHRIKKSLP